MYCSIESSRRPLRRENWYDMIVNLFMLTFDLILFIYVCTSGYYYIRVQSFIEIFVPLVDDVSSLLRTVSFWLIRVWWSPPLSILSLSLSFPFNWFWVISVFLTMFFVFVFPISFSLPSLTSSLLELVHTLWSLLLSILWVFKIHLLEQFFLKTFG